MSERSPTIESPSSLVRLLKYFFIGILFLVLLALLLAGCVNWRGGRAWDNFRAEWEAKGEHFALEDFIPKPVPPEQNFAATPLLAPLLDFTRVPGMPVQWKDPEGKKRVEALGSFFNNSGRRKTPSSGNWQTGTFIELTEWQEFLATDTNAVQVWMGD